MVEAALAAAPDPAVNSVTICNAVTMAAPHRAILQRLNRKVGDNYFPADQFAQSVDEWAGIPNIFANQHPDPDAYDADPEAELKRIGGRVIGDVLSPEIVTPGGARLEAGVDFGGDAEVEALNQAGELTGSTAFRCTVRNGAIASPPRPHHVLWFKEDLRNLGVDPGVVVLNKEENVDEEVTITNAGKVASTANAGKLKTVLAGLIGLFKDATGEDIATDQMNKIAPGAQPISIEGSLEGQIMAVSKALTAIVRPTFQDGTPSEIHSIATFPDSVIYRAYGREGTYQIPYSVQADGSYSFGAPVALEEAFVESIANKEAQADPGQTQETDMEKAEFEAQILNKDTVIANKDAEIADLKAANARYQKEAADREWTAFLNNNKIPVGLTDTPEKEAELRQKQIDDPLGFTTMILNMKRPDEKPDIGAVFANKEAGDAIATVRELRASTGR